MMHIRTAAELRALATARRTGQPAACLSEAIAQLIRSDDDARRVAVALLYRVEGQPEHARLRARMVEALDAMHRNDADALCAALCDAAAVYDDDPTHSDAHFVVGALCEWAETKYAM